MTAPLVDAMPCAFCGASVRLLPKGWTPGTPLYCEAHALLADVDPMVHGPKDLDRAIAEQQRDARDLLAWPWPSLDAMAGPLAPGTVTYLGGFPKSGKTSVLADLIDAWWTAGKRLFIMPLEASKYELYTRLACLHLGLDPDFALSKRLLRAAAAGDYHAKIERDELVACFRRWQTEPERLEGLWLQPARVVTDAVLRTAMRQARDAGADVFIVDHVDHVQGSGTGPSSGVDISFQAQLTCQELAQEYDLTVLLATQLNERATGHDATARFRPPLLDWLWMPGRKQQVATTILGLYRPQRPDVTDSERLDVRTGVASVESLLLPNRMGIAAMAQRYSVGRVAPTVQLHFSHGRLCELSDAERREDEATRHAIRTDNSPSRYRGAERARQHLKVVS